MAAKYYCGPQSWPQWLRKPLSRYYNRACREHDEDYDDASTPRAEAEAAFKVEITRRRRSLRKARKRRKIKLSGYLIHGVLFGYVMPFLTNKFGRYFKNG